jgi:DNA-binding NtrC family response regulator
MSDNFVLFNNETLEINDQIYPEIISDDLGEFQFVQEDLIGKSNFIANIKEFITTKISNLDNPVLLSEEYGCEAEYVAYHIHKHSKRCSKPFLKMDCSQLPKSAHESKLFINGLVEKANGGTLLLKNILELSIEAQSRLAKYIKDELEKANTRIIAIMDDQLKMNISFKTFRKDLYYLLNNIRIDIIPLRERKEDIEDYLTYYEKRCQAKYKKNKKMFSIDALEIINNYYYPGNTKELKNIIEWIYLTVDKDVVKAKDLPLEMKNYKEENPFNQNEFCLDKIINRHISKVLKMVGGNRKKAAVILGISERSLYYKVKNELDGLIN